MSDQYRDDAPHSVPPPPPYAPWPPRPEPEPGPRARARKKARGSIALLVAVAIGAATVGGAASTVLGQLTDDRASRSSAGVQGTNVSANRSAGSVAGVVEAVAPSTVEIRAAQGTGQSTGSGVIISSDGEIITNNHVLAGAKTVQVRLSGGKTYTADVVGTAPDKDLALIKLRGASGLKAAQLGDSGSLRVGDQVVAIGSPEGLTGTVTSGIVSAVDRDVTVPKGSDQPRQPDRNWPFEFGGQQFNGGAGESTTTYKAIQTDAPLNPGNSGGALIDMQGRIIGINSAMYAPSNGNGAAAGSVGLGFAIPVDTVKSTLDDLRAGAGAGSGTGAGV
ncbi:MULTISPECIES: S1C family serine protease [Streptomyces]|uniref:Serine protease n=1 Tax=Streptomyces tsukubensis (strain DSM 42081 / NBRC 108919 / NRRL 18488 / 9993) TaxID=1114943 RepID=I2N174_STRT9|nr:MULTISPECIES: trypsin-like peptidase domain-containing protein [Streptomyces]AZK94958.1 serine protease [Streptomyces tsukubensis]EIF90771.1 peptidase S1 and S6 chymotrypsin/Hap [Streptomyces tsukubensis NRRL18488]MYS64807.1 trypsin-like serine protease [Streptomyces sp. SID5473]QKM68969.1 serine protease [Streptomyces tsukubensis NRRL18488]TAI40815.1 serine protease [Streptomyces tsukubensis]